MDLNSNIARLLKKLIDDWMEDEAEYEEYYLELALTLVDNPNISRARWERELFHKIREELGPENWQSLPELIQEYRTAVRIQKEREREAKQRVAEEREEKERQKQDLLKTLRERFEQDFLNVDNFYQAQCTAHISRKEYEAEKNNYVQSWVADYLNTNASGQATFTPDSEQAAAIGAVEGNVQVVARAGSGKTATLVNRALFLQQHCGVAPDKILLLAFNRNAADEMRDRLASYLPDAIPHVMTFHALAYALVRPKGKILYDDSRGGKRLSRAIQNMIDGYRRDSNYDNKVRALMMEYFRADWEHIVLGGYDGTPEEMLSYRRSLLRESLDGTYVKSFGEKVIANFLFEHNIKYEYEQNFEWNKTNYHPDFTINKHKVVIEYFGVEGDPGYDTRSEEKRNYWRNSRPDWRLLEFFRHDLTSNGVEVFCDLLQQRLENSGITCNRLSESEIWDRIQDLRRIDSFTEATVDFIGRGRKLSLTPEQLSERINSHYCDSEVEWRFLDLAQVFYRSYLERLEKTGNDDFDGLMQKATGRVTEGTTEFRYKSGTRTCDLRQIRYVLIDEYQDFSELFHRLMEAVQEQNPKMRFFCVGDDWQAINGFAGSDLRFFQNFSQVFEDARELYVRTNYRSAPAIVNVGNALMEGQGSGKRARAHQTMKGKVAIANMNTFEPTLQEKKAIPGDDFTIAILRLVDKAINDGKNAVLLSRNNHLHSIKDDLNQFLKFLQSGLSNELAEKVTISTVHQYKGLEEDVVIVLDAVPGRYPLIHPNLIFTRVLGDSVERTVDEERRLFYVALTRAVKELFILTERRNVSLFLEDLERNIELPRLEWLDYPPTQYISIRVSNQDGLGPEPTKAIKGLLRGGGYRYRFKSNFWYSIRPAEGFSVSKFIDKAGWSKSADGVEVRFYGRSENQVAKYHVDRGQWNCIFDNISEPEDDIPF